MFDGECLVEGHRAPIGTYQASVDETLDGRTLIVSSAQRCGQALSVAVASHQREQPGGVGRHELEADRPEVPFDQVPQVVGSRGAPLVQFVAVDLDQFVHSNQVVVARLERPHLLGPQERCCRDTVRELNLLRGGQILSGQPGLQLGHHVA